MMANRYHVNPETGEAKPCTAEIQCRFGGDTPHFDTKEQAQEHGERLLSQQHGLTKTLKKKIVKDSMFSVEKDEEKNHVKISVKSIELYGNGEALFDRDEVSIEELFDKYSDEVSNFSGLLDPETAAMFILHGELSELYNEVDVEQLRTELSGYSDEGTTFSFEFSDLDEAEAQITRWIAWERQIMENRGQEELPRSVSHQWRKAFREFRDGLNESQYEEFEDACSEFGSFITSAKIDEETDQPVITLSLDELIEQRREFDDEFAVIMFGDYDAYEECYEWDFDEGSEEWKFVSDRAKLREHTERAIEKWFDNLKSDAQFAFYRVGLQNILLRQRIVEKEGAYRYGENPELVSKQLEAVLSSGKELDVQFVQKKQWFDVDDVMTDLEWYLEEASHPDQDPDLW